MFVARSEPSRSLQEIKKKVASTEEILDAVKVTIRFIDLSNGNDNISHIKNLNIFPNCSLNIWLT